MRPSYLVLAIPVLAFLFPASPLAQHRAAPPTTSSSLRAKAAPDECFAGLGENRPLSAPPCWGGRAKVNQAYVWAMTQVGDDIWFGTVANPQCLTQGGLGLPEQLTPSRNSSWACEFGVSPYAQWLPPSVGDFRPPQMFIYSKTTRELTDLTPRVPVTPENPFGVDPRVLTTVGVRAAANANGVVLFAGTNLLGGLNMFAFRADTREYLGSAALPEYTPIRQFTMYDGQLYTTVGRVPSGGAVLKWTGSASPPPCVSCFTFEVVGETDGGGAYITSHEGRLYVTTWPSLFSGARAGLFMSPVVPSGGLTPAQASGWQKVWDAADYEPDPLVAATYAGGALASFDGYLYWGTLHIPWAAAGAFVALHGLPTDLAGATEIVRGTFRAAVLFRGRAFDTAPDIDLLYGWPKLSVYQPPAGEQPGQWALADNNMPAGRKAPLYGPAGFGNPYNTYIWSMAVWDSRLWIGTMDWSYPAEHHPDPIIRFTERPPYTPDLTRLFPPISFGADLFYLRSARSPAAPEDVTGLGNYTNYGVRNLLPGPTLFVGMANPSNLLTGLGLKGGWELIELQPLNVARQRPLLTGFTCTPGAPEAPGTATCTLAVSGDGGATGIKVRNFPMLGLPEVDPPAVLSVARGQTTRTFTVRYTEPSSPTVALLIAELNGGTMVASLPLGAPASVP